MAPSRASTSQASNINSVYALALLAEYNHSLDTLPHDLSRNFADLRELDAVLSSSMASIIIKISHLTKIIQQGSSSTHDRLLLLADIADEAARLKLGGEDKIRVACQAADGLKGHVDHMRLLLGHVPSFDLAALNRRTSFPHIPSRSYMPIPENSRRRRANYSSILGTLPDVSPAKRKRNTRDDDVDLAAAKSPRKDSKAADAGPSRPRNGARSRKPDRAPSPTESVLSVTSHIPPSASSRPSLHPPRGGNIANKRSKTLVASQSFDDTLPNGMSRREVFPAPPTASSAHPSLPLPYANGANGLHSYEMSNGHAIPNDWPGPPLHGQLEGPGMPVTRNVHTALSMSSAPVVPTCPANDHQASAVDTATEAGEGEGEGDDQTYCVCESFSYGEMIACDGEDCEQEWFHIGCVGLSSAPGGSWFCDTCRTKQKNIKRITRAGKKRVSGARSGGKAANNS